MQVVHGLNKINFTFEQNSTYYYLQTVIDRNFQDRIGRKNKMIIFPKEDEEIQRRYLLKLISKIYKKQNHDATEDDIQKIKNAYDGTIKLTLELKNQILPDLKIKVGFDDTQAVVFYLENNNRLFVNYMKNYFKGHLLQYRPRTHIMNIFPNSDETILRLQKLFSQREHMAWYITFDYELKSYNDFSEYWFNRSRRKRRFKSLNGIMEEYFNALGCTGADSPQKVRQRYLQLVKMYHPDRHANAKNSEVVLYYKERFQRVQTAYEILKAFFQDEEEKSATA